MTTTRRIKIMVLGLIGMLFTTVSMAQTKLPDSEAELYRQIAHEDSILFEAYNTCNLEKFATYFTEDVEFYHDKGGLSTSKKELIEALRNNICGKVRRELVKGSLEVYPINNYGAVEIGNHRFYSKQDGKDVVGIAKFVHLWQLQPDGWKVMRVISFDHKTDQKQ